MKTIVFASICILIAFVTNAQITLDKKYDYSTSIVNLETLGYKYFIMDVPNGQCRIYNYDHSLFKTINCNVPGGYYLSDIKFISEKLFDTDSGIELLCSFYKYNSSMNYYEYASKIINEDGSLIQLINGALYNFINYTSEKTYKLFSYCYDYSVFPEKVWTDIYDLIENPVYGEEQISICSGSDYLGWTEPGYYQRTIVLENGVDSIVTTHLNVISAIERSEWVSICEGESYKGLSETGNYSTTFTAISGCDSILTTILTVLSSVETIQNITICEGETYKGLELEGQYSDTIVSFLGCDSINIINLSFSPTSTPEIIIQGDTLKSNISFEKYQWIFNENEIISANSSEYIISESGEYSLKITDNNGCSSISKPVNVVFSSGSKIGLNDFEYSIVPNPNNGMFNFRVDSNPPTRILLNFLNNTGQIIITRLLKEAKINYTEQFNISHLAKGIYFLQIEFNNTVKTEKVILK